jgi:DNA-binding NtrC family response regulator
LVSQLQVSISERRGQLKIAITILSLSNRKSKMIVVKKANVLTVGVADKAQVLKELNIRVISLQFGKDAVRSLKSEEFDSVISRWDLLDMKNGTFLQGLKNIKRDMPTIAVIESGNTDQEISARSLGVSAVITEDINEDHFRELISQLLGLEEVEQIKEIYATIEA